MPKNLEGNIQYQSLISKWQFFKKTEKEAVKKRLEAESALLAMGVKIVSNPDTGSFSIVNKK